MPEAVGTIFTILLFMAAFVGSGGYAVLSMADFRAARRGFWATAISFAAIGLVLGIMTTWPLPVRIIACALFLAIARWQPHLDSRLSPSERGHRYRKVRGVNQIFSFCPRLIITSLNGTSVQIWKW